MPRLAPISLMLATALVAASALAALPPAALTSVATAMATAPVDLATVDRDNVLGRLGVYTDPLARKGWLAAPGLEHMLGTLAPGAARSFTLPLVTGYTYRALGACGRECADLDLLLTDPAGQPVAQDRRADGIPVLAFRAQATGNYVLTVRMANCNVEACTYGVAFYANPRPR